MMMMLMFILFMSFYSSRFSGVFIYLMMFIYLLMNYSLLGVEMYKGDLYGILGLDYISFYMILLLLWVISLVLILFYSWLLFILSSVLMFSMMMMFSSMDFVSMFIYFEFSMIPMFMMIVFMGFSKERYFASLYMFIYTMMSSLPMLFTLLCFNIMVGFSSIDYYVYNLFFIDSWIQIFVLMMFLVKVPMFLVHIWLPKAHVEAPVFGSMVLASVMLKMGAYGIIRCLSFMELSLKVSDFFFCFCLCGSLMISYLCLFQIDLKVLVAYSSIIHMGVMLMGFFSMVEVGYLGGVIMMLSHGICSSGLFYLVNEIYKVSGSRLLLLNKGLVTVMPMLVGIWFIMLVNNLGVPPCFGILGELMLIVGCLNYSLYVSMFFFIIIFFVSCFIINMFAVLMSGYFFFYFVNISVISYYGGLMHLFPLNMFIFFIGSCM